MSDFEWDSKQESEREAREQAAKAEREQARRHKNIYKIEDAAKMLREYGEDDLAEQVEVAAGRLWTARPVVTTEGRYDVTASQPPSGPTPTSSTTKGVAPVYGGTEGAQSPSLPGRSDA